jgi:chloramphenicol-sensitive protein RarD
VNTALGVLALGERLRGLQKVAIALATIGVVIFAIMTQKIPGLAIGLAVSFGIYGLFRKTVAADALTGLATECMILTPFALSYLIWLQLHGAAKFGHFNQTTDLLLMAGGIVTVFPLYCFAQAARRLRLTTIGFLQFLAPTLQFALAITAGHEEFKVVNLVPFTFIWLAILIYTRDILRKSPS